MYVCITCSNKPANSSLYCGKCYKLETQLKDTSNELSSVKLIIEILNEEIKALKQTPNNDANTNRPRGNARTSGPCGPAIVQPKKKVPTTHGIPTTDQYALPVSNQYDAYLIDMNHLNLVTLYSPQNLCKHLNLCRISPTSTSQDLVEGNFQQ